MSGESKMNSDPVCGNCGKPKSKHYFKHEIFCYTHTTGDIYRTEPREDFILDKMAERYPELYQELVDEWKRDNEKANQAAHRIKVRPHNFSPSG